MEDRVTVKKIRAALGISRQRVETRAEKEAWPFEEAPSPGRGGKCKLYPLETLPADVRAALGRVAASEAAAAGRREGLKLKLEREAAEAVADAARQEGLAKFVRMGGKAKARAEARATLLAAFDEFIRTTGLPPSTARHIFSVQYRDGVIQIDAEVRALLPKVCATSIGNWQKAIAEKGVSRLAGNFGHRRGTGKIDRNPEITDFIKGILTVSPLASATFVQEGLKVRFPDAAIELRAVQRWMRQWKDDNPRLYCDLQSPDTCRSRYQPATGSRIEGIVRPNQRWEMDSTKGDVMLWDGQTRSRHMIVACIDVYTRRVKFLVSRSSSAAAVAALLRCCLLEWGQVEELGTDNGADFVAKHIVRLSLALGIERDVAQPFTPEHKPFVERVFGTFLHGLFEGLSGYIGHNVAERKAIEDRKAFAERLSKGLYKGDLADTPELLLSPEALQKFCDEWADAYYAHKPHSGEGMDGKTPWEKASEWTQPIAKIQNVRALDILLSPVVGKDGWRDVKKKGLEIDTHFYTAPELGGHEGRQVFVLQDEADWGAVHVFLPKQTSDDLEYLCRAVCPLLTGISRQEAAMARRRVYDKIRAEEKAAMKATAKRVGAQDVMREVMEHAVEKANKLSRIPQPTVPHETPMLAEAAIAARAGDAPTPHEPTAAELAARAALAEDMAREKATVHAMPEAHVERQRYNRWLAVDAAIRAGQDVPERDRKWWESYQKTPKFLAERQMRELFPQLAEAGQ
jgi:hypothetical protein